MTARDQVYTIKELADRFQVHPTTIYRLLRQGRLPGFRIGSNWRFNRSAIEQWESGQAFQEPTPIGRGRKRRDGI